MLYPAELPDLNFLFWAANIEDYFLVIKKNRFVMQHFWHYFYLTNNYQ